MKRILFFICTFFAVSSGYAQQFDALFRDSTLRIDYIFAGNAKSQSIYVDKLNMMAGWYGKHHRLAEVPVEGKRPDHRAPAPFGGNHLQELILHPLSGMAFLPGSRNRTEKF